MSIEAVTWALSVPVSGSAKVVLLGLANHAHPDGTESYPALATLAKYGDCDRSTVRRQIRKLVAEGWLIPTGKGPQGQRKYSLPLDRREGVAFCHPGVASLPRGGGIAAHLGVAPMPPEPSSNHPEENSPSAQAREATTGTPTLSIEEERRALADHIRGILQRGVDGLTTMEFCKPVGRGAILAALAAHPHTWESAEAAAQWARGCAQSMNRAPNIVALFAQRLAQTSSSNESTEAA